MLGELKPVWKQFVETWLALEAVLDEIPDDRLHWAPTPNNWTPARIVLHIARANICYSNLMVRGEEGDILPADPDASRERLKAALASALDIVRDTMRDLPPERLHAVCATDWEPLGPVVKGNQDALWFAMQIVRHTAYHLGQLNYVALML